MLRLILEIFIFIGACIVFPLVFILGFCYTIVKHVLLWDYSISKQLTPIIRSASLLLDGFANAGGGEMLNDVFKVTGSLIRYGKWYQTISAITGLLLLHVKDIKLRPFLDRILGENHCVDAITPEDKFYYEQVYKQS